MIKKQELTFEGSLHMFERELLKSDHSGHTVKNYLCDLKNFAEWLHKIIPAVKLGDIDTFTLQRYRGYLDHTEKRAAATINRRIQSLRRFFSWALKEELIETDPSTKVKLKNQPRILKPKSLTKSELHKVLTFAGKGSQGVRNYALVQLMLQAGLRIGEVETLQRDDVSLYERSGQVRIRDGKGRKERFVPLNASVRKALQNYLEAKKTKNHSESEAVFTTSTGKRLAKRALQKIITEIMVKADCKASAHTLRHTFATAHYNDHKKLVELSTLLGHSSLNTTARYTQASQADLALQLEESSLNEFGE